MIKKNNQLKSKEKGIRNTCSFVSMLLIFSNTEYLDLLEGSVLSIKIFTVKSDVQQFRQGDYTMGRQQRFLH